MVQEHNKSGFTQINHSRRKKVINVFLQFANILEVLTNFEFIFINESCLPNHLYIDFSILLQSFLKRAQKASISIKLKKILRLKLQRSVSISVYKDVFNSYFEIYACRES